MGRTETRIETTTQGDKVTKKTITTKYRDDGSVESVNTQTETSTNPSSPQAASSASRAPPKDATIPSDVLSRGSPPHRPTDDPKQAVKQGDNVVYVYLDHTQLTYQPGADTIHYIYPTPDIADGAKQYSAMPDGREQTHFHDGRSKAKFPNGAILEKSPDGYSKQLNADGTAIEKWPDGHTLQTDTSGNTVESFPAGVDAPDWLPKKRIGDWGRGPAGSTFPWPKIQRIHTKPHTTQYHGVDGTIIDVPRIDPGPNEDRGDMIVEWQGDRENQAEEVCLDGETQKLNYYGKEGNTLIFVPERQRLEALQALEDAMKDDDIDKLKRAITQAQGAHQNTDEAEKRLKELESKPKLVKRTQNIENLIENGRRIKRTTTTTEYSDGSSTTNIENMDEGPEHSADWEAAQRNLNNGVNNPDITASELHDLIDIANQFPGIDTTEADDLYRRLVDPIYIQMQQDLKRLEAENRLKKCIDQAKGPADYQPLEAAIDNCDPWRNHPDTWNMINRGYEKLGDLKPQEKEANAAKKLKSLPFIGMKRFLVLNGVERKEADVPLSKYGLEQLAKKHGIQFPPNPDDLRKLMKRR